MCTFTPFTTIQTIELYQNKTQSALNHLRDLQSHIEMLRVELVKAYPTDCATIRAEIDALEELLHETFESLSTLDNPINSLELERSDLGRKPTDTSSRDQGWALQIHDLVNAKGLLIKDATLQVAKENNVSSSTVKLAWDKQRIKTKAIYQVLKRLAEGEKKRNNQRAQEARQELESLGFLPEPVLDQVLFDAFHWRGPLPAN